jgi:ribonuclease HI
MGLNFVDLHVDSLVVVQAIQRGWARSLSGQALVKNIRRLLDSDWEVIVSHSYREANKCADALATYGCSLDRNIMFFYRCSSQISQLLLAGVTGFTTPKLFAL